jgi:hypothetical protein
MVGFARGLAIMTNSGLAREESDGYLVGTSVILAVRNRVDSSPIGETQ